MCLSGRNVLQRRSLTPALYLPGGCVGRGTCCRTPRVATIYTAWHLCIPAPQVRKTSPPPSPAVVYRKCTRNTAEHGHKVAPAIVVGFRNDAASPKAAVDPLAAVQQKVTRYGAATQPVAAQTRFAWGSTMKKERMA